MWPFSTIKRLRQGRDLDWARIQELEEALRDSLARENCSNFIAVAKDFNSAMVDKLVAESFVQVVDKYEFILHTSIFDALEQVARRPKESLQHGRASVAFSRSQAYYEMVIHIPDFHHVVKVRKDMF